MRDRREREHNHLHVISREPLVVYAWLGRDQTVLHKELRDRDLTVLYLDPWYTSDESMVIASKQIGETRRRFPSHRIVVLCNEAATVEPWRQCGVEAIFCNQNAFIDETAFRPLSGVARSFDAVYSASLAPYKRHHLAAKVASLALLSYTYSGTTNNAYQAQTRTALAHATWLKAGPAKITTEAMVDFYNRARVGLILSEFEGSVFASVEYLLCGLPVVSTPSRGGREVFWDDRFVIVSEATADAVADAVAELVRRDIDPQLIRSATLTRMEQHRQALRELLGFSFACPWPPGSHGPFTFTNLRQLGRVLKTGAGPLS